VGTRRLTNEEVGLVLAKERIVRVAFFGADGHFLVPMFYAWWEGTLCGLTTPGRKVAMARANDRVAFQVDSTATTGPWEWASVSGHGRWVEVGDPLAFAEFAPAFYARLADAPGWATAALEARFGERGVVGWRIVPEELSGRAHGPEEMDEPED
jgi:nitroimidazol reductase NimA-like FMN-containing flavoprotein (pyridoxamine 5'-phosphate oxidase superfamily)